jgi:hypothetical protein
MSIEIHDCNKNELYDYLIMKLGHIRDENWKLSDWRKIIDEIMDIICEAEQ